MATVDILLVGTFHMANPASDMANARIDDVLADSRQRELMDVADHLGRFAPNKVAVEHPCDDPGLNDRYRDFLRTQQLQSRSETEQLGFRVAAAAGHDQVFPIDVMDVFYEARIEQLISASPGHAAQWEALRGAGEASAREVESSLRAGTIGSVLRTLNAPDARRRALTPYLDHLLPISASDNWAGADMVANWYRRNIRIAVNFGRIVNPGDRVLVLYGSGHAPVLEHLWQFTSVYKLVDPLDYLPRG